MIKTVCAKLIPKLFNESLCPCCDGRFRKFQSFKKRKNARCPNCGSLERHRLLWLYLKNKTNFFAGDINVLHFAPEQMFQKIFSSIPKIKYFSADISSPTAKVRLDITNVPFEDNSIDVILCMHVLEHIADDRRAMRELFRILKPGGWAILQVPMRKDQKTFEDPNITSPQEREAFFGQSNHVRFYGYDYKDRLEEAGFNVKVDTYVRDLGPELIKKYGLTEEEDIYFSIKAV